MDGNYIKIFRTLLEWEWYSDINTCRLFLHMLLKANWKEGKFQGTTVPRGSFVSSIERLSEETKLTKDEVRTAIKHLICTEEITKQSTNKFTVFTIKNYALHQDIPSQEPNQIPSSPQPIPNLFPTIEEGKKERREEGKKEKKEVPKGTKKKEPVTYYPNDEILNQAFCDYVDMRMQIKKPMTERAITIAMNKLRQLSETPLTDGMDNDRAVRILEQSILNNWQGLFALKDAEPREKNTNTGVDWSKV